MRKEIIGVKRLAEIAKGRDYISTAEYACVLGIKPQSARRHACFEKGPVRPIRACGRLHWPVDQLNALLSGAVVQFNSNEEKGG
jgi:hypothetical protein